MPRFKDRVMQENYELALRTRPTRGSNGLYYQGDGIWEGAFWQPEGRYTVPTAGHIR